MALVTLAIPMVMWYVAEISTISYIFGADRTVEEYWSDSMPFTWSTPWAQWRGQ